MTLTERAIARCWMQWAQSRQDSEAAELGSVVRAAGFYRAKLYAEKARHVAARRERTHLRALVADLRDASPCWYDHHGFCQGHGWMDESECPHARAARVLGVAP